MVVQRRGEQGTRSGQNEVSFSSARIEAPERTELAFLSTEMPYLFSAAFLATSIFLKEEDSAKGALRTE